MPDEKDSGFFNFLGEAADSSFGFLGDMFDDSTSSGKIARVLMSAAISKYTQPQTPDVGYQGKADVDKLVRVRKPVERSYDPSAGRDVGILSAVKPDLATMGTMDFSGADFSGMSLEETDAEKQKMLASENAKRTAAADAQAISQGDKYDQGLARRPGANNRRYFTDTIYAQRPETEIPTLAEAEATASAQAAALGATGMAMGGRVPKYAQGGIAGAHKGYYLGGKTDGMADKVPARIDGNQEARLSDGEFVIPADVVSHLGNGNSDAGADQLHSMMDGVRKARTGNPNQGKQIDPQNFMPKMAQGGIAKYAGGGNVNAVQGENSRFKNQPYTTNFDGLGGTDPITTTEQDASNTGSTGTDTGMTDNTGAIAGTESSLSNWAGDYVTTGILEPAAGLAKDPYEAYQGPLTAGASTLQSQGFTGISQLNNPTSADSITNQMGGFTPDAATLDPYMNPYTDTVINRTAADMRRQSQIDALGDRSAMTNAGAFGGSRDALLRAERAGNLNRGIGDMAAAQRAQGFDFAVDRARTGQEMTNKYGMDVLAAQTEAGGVQRGIASEGIAADYEEYIKEQDYDYKQLQFLHSLLQGMPLSAQSRSYTEPSQIDELVNAGYDLQTILRLVGLDGGSGSESETELNYDINNDGVEDEYDVGPAQPV